jgi:hypothetical protein
MRGEQARDASLGWRQGNRWAGHFLAAGVRLAGDGARTIRRGPPVRHRPKWLISRIYMASLDSTPCSDNAVGAARVSGGTTRSLSTSPATPRVTPKPELCSPVRRRLTLVLAGRRGAATLHRGRTCPGIAVFRVGRTRPREHVWALWPSPFARPEQGHRHRVPNRAERNRCCTKRRSRRGARTGSDRVQARRPRG